MLWQNFCLTGIRFCASGVPHAGNRIVVSASGEQVFEAGSYVEYVDETVRTKRRTFLS